MQRLQPSVVDSNRGVALRTFSGFQSATPILSRTVPEGQIAHVAVLFVIQSLK